VTKITFEKIVNSTPVKVFDIISNFENYEKLFPDYYPLIRIKSVRDESSLVVEHLKLHDKEFVIMAKHFNDPPHKHEMRVVGGDIKGSYIIEKIIPFELETKIIVEAEINTGKRFSILKNINYEKALENLYDEVVTVIESC
jgi:coenzyme Q-binding protein COQ10